MTTPPAPPPPVRPPREMTGLPTVVAAVVALLAFPAVVVALLPVPDTSTVEAKLRMDPRISRITTWNFLAKLDEGQSRELSAALEHEQPVVRAAALRALGRLARLQQDVLLEALADDDDGVKLAALEILSTRYSFLPPEAVSAVAALAFEPKTTEGLRLRAFSTLSQAREGWDDGGRLVDIVVDPQEPQTVRWYAAAAVRDPSDADVARLRENLRSKNLHLRRNASQALVAAASPTASEALIDALGDAASSTDFAVYTAAAGALAGVGPRARRLAPKLRDAVLRNRANPHGAFQLLVALQNVGIAKDDLTPAFLKLEDAADPRIRNLVKAIRQKAR